MHRIAPEEKRRWVRSIAGACGIVAATVLLFRAPDFASVAAQSPAMPGLSFKRLNPEGETADFHDPSPLFLPTKWDARPNARSEEAMHEPGDGFRYDAQFRFDVNTVGLNFPEQIEVPHTPVDVMSLWAWEQPFPGMGQTDTAIPVLSGRDALVEVVAAGDGRQIFTQTLAAARPPGNGDWQPMEFLISVGPSGLDGLPVPAPSANTVEVVAYFQNYLANTLRVGDRLAPGIYRIKVGP